VAPEVRILQAAEAEKLLPREVAIVVDVLRATTTTAVLLHRGARRVFPVQTPEDALVHAKALVDPILVGERERGALPGFTDNSPARAATADVAGRDVVFTTTNGTRVLLECRRAGTVLTGALVNAAALAAAVQDAPMVAVVACGWKGEPAEDDNAAALYIADLVAGRPVRREHTVAGVLGSVSAQRLSEHGKKDDVELALRFDAFPVVPVLRSGALVPMQPTGLSGAGA